MAASWGGDLYIKNGKPLAILLGTYFHAKNVTERSQNSQNSHEIFFKKCVNKPEFE